MGHKVNVLTNSINCLLRPIVADSVYFLSLFVLLYIPSLFYWIKNFSPFFKYYGILALPAVFFITYILCLFVSLLSRNKYRTVVKRMIFALVYIITTIETYIIIFFGTRFSLSIITLILETNSSEASGFFTSFILTPAFAKYIIAVFAFTILIILINRNPTKIIFNKFVASIIQYRIIKLILLFVVVLCGSIGIFREGRNLYWHKYNIDEIGRVRKRSAYSTTYISLSCLYDSFRMYRLSTLDLPMLIKTLKETTIDGCEYRSKNVVVVILESYNKYHSNLYGYPLKTNPFLEKEENLYVFNDAITTDGLTSIVMKNIFSFRDKENDLYWTSSPLFPSIFKKAGYLCTFISNQEVESDNSRDVYDRANDYLVNPQTKHLLWDVTNNKKFQYDLQLIDEYVSYKDTINPYSLTVFHLLGQHTAYEDRYPSDKGVFTSKDYEYRTDLTDYQKKIVSHYDNATRYCDEVLKRIIDLYRNDDAIIIFLSDHGEEIYDYRDYAGRSHEPIITAGTAKYVYEVPFFIWISDKYKTHHHKVVNQIEKSLDKPFVIDDLPHLLLDIAGINVKDYNPIHSVLNDKYIRPRRLIGESKQDFNTLLNYNKKQ